MRGELNPADSMPFPVPSFQTIVAKCAAWAIFTPFAALVVTATESGLESRPLAPFSAPRGATMFADLDPAATGIRATNDYSDPRMWNERYHEFEIGTIGTGVAIADYDRDGRPDAFIVSKTESCHLFRNLGGMRFEDVTVRAGVGDAGAGALEWKQGAAFADVNNDGWPDLYLCRNNATNLLYINQGDGTFREEGAARGLAIREGSSMAAFCDYDRDGSLDMYLQTNLLDNAHKPNGQPDYLFHNNGDGTFTDVTEAAGIDRRDTQGNSATWWDHDSDGWPDLYIANDFYPSDMLYRNNRDGTFTNVIDQTVPHTPYSAMGGDIGDINNDGLIDFFVADMAATTHVKDQRTMAGTRAKTRDPATGDTSAPPYLWNSVFLNTGTPRMLEVAHLLGLTATDWTWSPRFEDLDNDGRIDFHVTNGMHREIHNIDLIGRMMAAESATERIRIARRSPVLVETNLAFRNLGDLRFESIGREWGLDKRGVSFGSAFGDLDGDGDLDIVFTNYEAGPTVLRNDSDSGNRFLVDLHGIVSNRFGVGATVRIETDAGVQVRQLVLARGYLSTSEPVLHFGLGGDTLVRSMQVDWPSGHRQVFENLPAGNRYTITEPSGAPPAREWARPLPTLFTEAAEAANVRRASREELVDEIAQQRMLPMRMNRRGPALAAGDLNADGIDDLVIGSTTLEPLRLLIGTPGGIFQEIGNGVSGTTGVVNGGPVLIFDSDGDGRADIFATRGGNSYPVGSPELQPALILNKGASLETAPAGTLPSIPVSIGGAAVTDFDGDGRLDVFLGGRVQTSDYPQSPRSFLLQNRGGRFEDVTDSVAPALRKVGMVTSALWSDVDGDGRPDLVLALEWGPIRVFLNRDGKLVDATETLGFSTAGTGWWTSLATADFNGDGHPDFVAGNTGLNTRFTAPASLFVGDFKGDGLLILIEARQVDGVLVPERSRREIVAAIPSVGRRFPTNDQFSAATLPEILGAEKLAAAQRFDATELRNGVLLSQSDGRYRWEPLPRMAQISPFQGIVAGDFDGDGRADIYAVQNSYAPSPITGRFDGGLSLLLRGDGRGGFTPVLPAESGLIVPGDAKALVVLDSDGDSSPDFMLSRNNDTTLLFRNRPHGGNQWLWIALTGPQGNPTAIGARVTVTHADGTTQTVEVGCGSGWMSQSTAKVFVGRPAANPIQSIEIRWPGGAVSKHTPPAEGDLKVAQP